MFIVNKDCSCQNSIKTFKGEASQAQLKTHEGLQFLVVPVVAIVEGILNNALVPMEEFARFVDAWEGRPVPVTHPEINGEYVSANRLEIKEKYVIGTFQNVKAEANKLKGEIWIDIAKAIKKGFSNLVENLKAGKTIEVSTAYFADVEEKSGEFGGQPFDSIHRNLRPDHLALLPNDKGACSVEDGCGTFQNALKEFSTNLFAQLKKFTGHSSEADAVKKEDLVKAIIANKATQFIDKDEKTLLAMDEEVLKKMLPNEEEQDPEEKNDEGDGEGNQQQKNNIQLNAEDQAALTWAKKTFNQHKEHLVNRLKVNKACEFSEEELKAMSIDYLEKIDRILNVNSIDYSGGGLRAPLGNTNDDKIEPLQQVPVVLAKVEDKK